MTKADEPGKRTAPAVDAPRHPYGPRQLAALMPDVVRPAYRKRSPAAAQLMADWEAIMGPEIGRTTAPRKLFSGSLTIVCSGPVAMELQHLSDMVMNRINAHLGRIAVTRLRFVQDVFSPSAGALLPASQPPKPKAAEAARRAVADLPDGELRDALERLGRVVLTSTVD